MRYEVKSIGLWALIKVSFFLNLAVGFIVGIFAALYMVFIFSVMSQMSGIGAEFGFPDTGPPLGFSLVAIPILFAIMGAIFHTMFAAVIAGIYNLIARLFGGFELNLRRVEQPQPSPPPAMPPAPDTFQPPPPDDATPGPSQPDADREDPGGRLPRL